MNALKSICFFTLLLLIISCTTSSSKVTTTKRDPATRLEPRNGGESLLDIRRVPLPNHLKAKSEKENGIQIFECFVEIDSCQPLVNEVITYEEAKMSLTKHNIDYITLPFGVLLTFALILTGTDNALAAIIIGEAEEVTMLTQKLFPPNPLFSAHPTEEGRQVQVGYLPKDGPLLRKILSEREVIPINNIERLKRELTEIIQLIVNNRR